MPQPQDARLMTPADYASARADIANAPYKATIVDRDAADLATARARFPAEAAAYDAAVIATARENHRAVGARYISAELALADAVKLHAAAAAGPSPLDLDRAKARMDAAAAVRDDLLIATEAAHAAGYPSHSTGV